MPAASAPAPSPGPVPLPRLVVVGANHRSSSLTLRDRLFVEDAMVAPFLGRLREAGIAQAIVLSTCDRVEVHAVPEPDEDAATASRRALDVLAAHAGVQPGDLAGQVYRLESEEAVRHVFSVAASLDSLVVGEPQVLGQVKACHRLAQDAGMVGRELDALMQAAYASAKRARSETRIGEGAVSIATAAVQLARDLHGDLDRRTALIVGAGDMGELVGEALRSSKIKHMTVVHPTQARAETLARTLECHVAPFEDLGVLLPAADVVLTALNGRKHAISTDMIHAALRARKRKPMFVVDTGIPGDVEPAVNRIDEAFLYDLNDLERVAMEGRAGREAEARKARDVVAAEVTTFLRGRAERDAVPLVSALRQRFDAERERVLAECGGDAQKATRLLVGRLLHDPSEALRGLAAEAPGEWPAVEAALRRIFRLDGH